MPYLTESFPVAGMSGGSVVESEHDRRRVLSREAINSFDTGHRIGAAAVPSSSCPMTPANTENIHTAQAHPSETYMRAGPHPQPNNSAASMQAPLNTASIHQRSMKVVPSSTVDQDQRPIAHGGRLKIPTPPVVSAFVERVMKGYQPDTVNTEDTYRHQYKLPEREWAARCVLPQGSLHTRHGTATTQQLPCSQPAVMFPEHIRIPASPTQSLLYKTGYTIGQPPHQVVMPPSSLTDDSVNNTPVNVLASCVQATSNSGNVNVQTILTASKQILQEASRPPVRDSENLCSECNVIDLSQDKTKSEDNVRCQMVKLSDKTPRLHNPVTEKSNCTSPTKTISEVSQSSDCIHDNIPNNPCVNSSETKTVHHSESLIEKCKSEPLRGTPEKRLRQDPDNKVHALPDTNTDQVTAMDLSPSNVDCTTKSSPSPYMLGTSYPQLSATGRPVLDTRQHTVNDKGVNCVQTNQELCTGTCCEQSRCATHTKRLAADGSGCCSTTQQSQQSPNDER